MRMSIQNEMPGYNAVDQLLNQQGVGLTPAEMHGLISGILCGGNKDSSWQPLVHDLTNEGLAFGHELAESLRTIHSVTSDSLEDDGFLFQLYLPEGDAVSVFERADALAGYTLAPREVQPIQTYLQDNLQCAEPLVRQIGCVIGTHAGPGAFGLAFFDQGLEL